ncbi:Crp/Fnr family transcriptional regulator [Oceanirhabdus sp. W0125-5]|uniref:Crp/Fnr family transcriptional regulator n=1 Tax=Oceanirhabdus sp. W0125-5 TaxID=2999116 RepID=UPI0022F34767|nr:Crp/Fnr family transcriptional regulator [Oceanirhabdus sp. W0125-5]WBW99337.1 Crp/Fnr family transcriptional regulator [Oceanirhabdus sp. W0125-5]
MYKELFNVKLQDEMESYFLKKLAPKGKIKVFRKNTIIDPVDSDNIYVFVEGEGYQTLISSDGKEKLFFNLYRGTIFGEMDYFEEERTCSITKITKDAKISIVNRKTLEEELLKKPHIYRYFLHSITRKYRLIMVNSADSQFNDAIGMVASFILHMVYLQNNELKNDNSTIMRNITHEEMSLRLGISRTTVTNCINHLKKEGIISIINRSLKIDDINRLESLRNTYW